MSCVLGLACGMGRCVFRLCEAGVALCVAWLFCVLCDLSVSWLCLVAYFVSYHTLMLEKSQSLSGLPASCMPEYDVSLRIYVNLTADAFFFF